MFRCTQNNQMSVPHPQIPEKKLYLLVCMCIVGGNSPVHKGLQ